MAYTISASDITTVTLSVINKLSFEIDANLFIVSIPKKNPDFAKLADIFGKEERIVINGKYVGTSTSDVTNYMVSLRSLINADVVGDASQESRTFNSDISGSRTVLVDHVDYNYVEGEPFALEWNITLIPGDVIST